MLSRKLTRITALVAGLLLTLPLAACGEDQGAVDSGDAQERTGEDTEADDGEKLTFEELLEDVDSRTGDVVSVTAAVDEVVTPGVFSITSPDGGVESMVVVDVEADEDIEAGTEVVVTGPVRAELDNVEVEELMEVQLEEELLNDWEDEPYLEAQEVDTSPNA